MVVLSLRVVLQRTSACGSELAREGAVSGDVVLVDVHIRFYGDGRYWFRPYGGSLGKAPSNQAPAPLTFGASLRLAIPSLRSCSVGPPPSAIHGRGRLNRHPCRFAHCAEPALGLPMGQIKINSQINSRAEQSHGNSNSNSFASKPAPTLVRGGWDSSDRHHNLVGAGLPAKAVAHPASATTDPPPSRASPLPQWTGVCPTAFPSFASNHSRPSVSSPALDLDAPPPREAEWRFCAVGNPAWMPG